MVLPFQKQQTGIEQTKRKLVGFPCWIDRSVAPVTVIFSPFVFREVMGTEELWPYLLAVSGIPALLQFVALPFFPEAPRYLYIDKGDTEGAKQGESTNTSLDFCCFYS